MDLPPIKTYLIKFTNALRHPGRILVLLIKAYRLWKIGGATAIALRLKRFNQRPLTQAKLWQHYRRTVNRTTFGHLSQRWQNQDRPSHPAPLIAIGLVIHHTTAKQFSPIIQAVMAQLYPHWELGIVADKSAPLEVQQVLAQFAQQDARVKVQFLPSSDDLSTALNASWAMVSGEFTLLLTEHHLLEKQALLRIAAAIAADQPDIIYADEAIVAADGVTLRSLILRPAFSLEYLRCSPEIARPLGFSTNLLKAIGGFAAALPSDYDLMLRAVELAQCIVHIPEILCLKRWSEVSSTDRAMNQLALTRHLAQQQQANPIVNVPLVNFFTPSYTLQRDHRVAIIIPTRNCSYLVKTCIESIKSTTDHVNYDIVVVDHASDEPMSLAYFSTIAKHCQVYRYEGVFNFSTINNWAIAQLTDQYSHYLFCNNDIEAIEAGWLERMLALGQQPDIGIVGAKLLYPDRRIQHAGMVIGLKGASEHTARFIAAEQPDRSPEPGYLGALVVNREVSAVTAACLLMRRDAFVAVQGFDEGFAVGFGDTDLCLRTQQAGYRVIFCGGATLIHHESYTRGKSDGWRDPHPQDSARFIARWKTLLKTGDPYYNPNLSQFSCDWAVKSPLTINHPLHRRVYRKS